MAIFGGLRDEWWRCRQLSSVQSLLHGAHLLREHKTASCIGYSTAFHAQKVVNDGSNYFSQQEIKKHLDWVITFTFLEQTSSYSVIKNQGISGMNFLTPKIGLLNSPPPPSCYTFPCKSVMIMWCGILITCLFDCVRLL